MLRHTLLRGCCILVSLHFIAASGWADRPNIVLILADDLGYGDCSVYNPQSKIKTPHIDQLAEEGLLFTDAHSAASTCTPSRYGLLTGVNPVRTGVLNTLLSRGDPIIAEEERTIASLLRDQGYVTRMIGKWHLGFDMDKSGRRPMFDFSKPLTGGPLDRGFDSWFGIHSSAGAQPLYYIDGRHVVAEPTVTLSYFRMRGGRETSVKVSAAPGFSIEETSPMLCRKAAEIIRDHAATEQTQPLFLYYASPIPHQPWMPSREFQGKSVLGDYGDFVMQLDDVVGRINEALKETGLDKNTLLIFTSDNGPGPDAVRMMAEQGHASAGVLKGLKSDSWEGGHRVPMIVKWPGRIVASSQTDATVNFTDFFATLAEMQGVDLTHAYPGQAEDSVSFYPVLLDSSTEHRRPAAIHGRHAVREGEWKLISSARHEDAATLQPSRFELYNLRIDLGEQTEVSQSHSETVERLFKEFQEFTNSRRLK